LHIQIQFAHFCIKVWFVPAEPKE